MKNFLQQFGAGDIIVYIAIFCPRYLLKSE